MSRCAVAMLVAIVSCSPDMIHSDERERETWIDYSVVAGLGCIGHDLDARPRVACWRDDVLVSAWRAQSMWAYIYPQGEDRARPLGSCITGPLGPLCALRFTPGASGDLWVCASADPVYPTGSVDSDMRPVPGRARPICERTVIY